MQLFPLACLNWNKSFLVSGYFYIFNKHINPNMITKIFFAEKKKKNNAENLEKMIIFFLSS